MTGLRCDPNDHPLHGLTEEIIGLAISGLGINRLCSGGCGDWTAVRLAALLRAARLSAHRGEEAHQQLQQGART